MSVNFGGPRGPVGSFGPGTPPSGRFRNMYQQSPPPGGQSRGMHKDKPVTFMPDVKIPRQPKQPDKPLPAYMRYSRKVWETVKAQNPEKKMWDIGKVIGEQWRNLPEDERQGFFAEYEVEKSEYQDAMKAYHNSSAYRDWLKAKEKAQQAMQEQQMLEKMMGQPLPKEEHRFQLQQMEDEDGRESRLYDDYSAKHVAFGRFQRNHKLIAEIFSDSTVPDIKSIVTKPRLENLKRQVESLMQHQKKLEDEIQDMEAKFEVKKAKIVKRSEEFEENIMKISGPPPPLEVTPESNEEKTEKEESEKSEESTADAEEDIAKKDTSTEKNEPKERGTETNIESVPEMNGIEKPPSTEAPMDVSMEIEEGKKEEVNNTTIEPEEKSSKERQIASPNDNTASPTTASPNPIQSPLSSLQSTNVTSPVIPLNVKSATTTSSPPLTTLPEDTPSNTADVTATEKLPEKTPEDQSTQ